MEISDNDSAMSSDNEKDVDDVQKNGEKKEASSVLASSKAKEKKIKDAAEEGDKKAKKVHLRKDKGYGDHL